MNQYRISLPWPPTNNLYWRHVRGRHYISEKGTAYAKAVKEIIQQQNLAVKLSSKLSVKIYAAPPDNRKRDIDNLAKGILDALTKAGFWVDDNQLDCMHVVRCEKEKGGRIFLEVRETDGILPVISEITEVA